MMKKNIKGIAAVAVALVLVITAGVYMADHNLKATDGTENTVESEEQGATAETDIALVEETPAEESAEGQTPAAEETQGDGETPAEGQAADDQQTTENPDADTTENTDAGLEDAEKVECTEHVDADGDGICDVCGTEVAAETEETEEEKSEGTVSITSSVDASQPIKKGTKITLTAVTEGFDAPVVHYQWMRTKDGENWETIEGANSSKYTFEMNDDNNGYQWKVRVTVDD